MKNKIIIFLLILVLFTGCNKSKMKCEKKEKNAGYTYNENYNFTYDKNGENLQKINIEMKYNFNELYTSDELETEYDKVKEYCDFYNSSEENIISCSSSLNKNVIELIVGISVNKIDDSDFEDIMYVTKEEINNITNTKKMLENVGYSCK